jgi:PhzF family phenazine biosynthesis protein
MSIPIFQVDAFTGEQFKGNPAAVCVMDKYRDDAWMQALAAEMNLSETAFVAPHEDPFKRAWRLRWFTPTMEVDLCGHATLATAHILFTQGYLKPTEKAAFYTRSGVLTCVRDQSGWITMDFPAKVEEKAAAPEGLLEGLGLEGAVYIGQEQSAYIIEVASPEIVRNLKPNYHLLTQVAMRGVMVTSKGDESYDFISRVFAPGSGIPEDPVTGSAHCCLTPYWASKLSKTEMIAYQASARGGVVRVKLNGNRVELRGQAVTVLRGELI